MSFWPFLAGSPDGLQPYDDGMWDKKKEQIGLFFVQNMVLLLIHQFILNKETTKN
jgi:hypothetical protein